MAVFSGESEGMNAVFKHRNCCLVMKHTRNVFDFSCPA